MIMIILCVNIQIVVVVVCLFYTGYSHSVKGSVWSKKSFPFFAENMTIRSILGVPENRYSMTIIVGVVGLLTFGV